MAKDQPEALPAQIRLVPIEDLIPYANNARTHSDEQVSQIAASIKEFGWTNPVLTDGADGVIAGHGRLLAAKKLKLKVVPVIELGHLSEAQKKAYILADNKLAENAGWDTEMLKIEFEALHELDFDLGVIGFDADELSNILGFEYEGAHEVQEDDDVPEVEEVTISRPGDVWTLGRHRLLCGDSGVPENVELLMQGELADSMVTDPPYGVNYSGKTEHLNNHGGGRARKEIANDNLGDYNEFFYNFLSIAPLASYNTAYIFMSGQELHTLRLATEKAGFYWSDWLVWVKNSLVLSRKDYNSKHEAIYYGWKGRHKFYGETNSTTILEYARPSKSELHPTMKPPLLIARLITDGSPPGGIIYEPFGGSGTALIASEQTGRSCRAIELDQGYCDVIVRRWQQMTGEQAVRQDGVLFDEAA